MNVDCRFPAACRRPAAPRGLTLLELVVVLAILAALAGLLIPVLANMTTRTHGSAGAANVGEIAKAVQTHESLYNEFPNGFDSLLEGDGTAAPTGVLGTAAVEPLGGGALAFADLAAAPRGQRIADALNATGITTTYVLNPGSANITFAPYHDGDGDGRPETSPGEVVVIDGSAPSGEVATLTDDGVAQLGLEPLSATATTGIQAYVAFGLGGLSNMVGRSMVEAPVHFPESGESPVNEYSRFLLIYAVPATGPARLATVAAAHEEGLSGLNSHLSEYYSTQQ